MVIGVIFGLLGIVCLFVLEFFKVFMDVVFVIGFVIVFVSFFCVLIGNVIFECILILGMFVI